MDPELERRFSALETLRDTVLTRVASLPEADRTLSPGPDAWSPAQVVTHLVLAEQEYLGLIARAAERGVGGLRPTRSPLVGLLCFVMRQGIPVPVPPGMAPPADASLEAAARIWEVSRADLRRWLESVDDPRREVLGVHPQLGPMSATQMLAVLDAHLRYHLKRMPKQG